jgi:small subunit ribosomal protein S2
MGVDIGAAETPDVEPAVEAGPVIREDLRTAEEVAAGVDAEAPGEAFELLSAPRGAPDDLAKLHGVGPQLVKKLNDAGVYHYWQLAAMTPADVEKLDAELKLNGRIARDGWVDQAKALLAA